jgi:DNA invertase Pin-like site-specific DNA recombinase
MPYAIYARRSTHEQDERQVQSIDDQLRFSRELARRLGLDVEIEIKESISAKEPYKKETYVRGRGGGSFVRIPARAEFSRLIDLVERGEITGVIAWHPDRLSRNEIDAATLTHLIRTGRLRDLHFCNYTFTNTPEGIMMLQMALSQSQYYSAKLGSDVARGLKSKVEKGWAPYRVPPGYRNDKHKEKGRKTVSPDPQRFQTIRKVWDLALAASHNRQEILSTLNNDWQYRTPVTKKGGGIPMSKSTLYSLLSNVFYTGHFLHKGVLYKGSHRPMITMDEFRKVQELHVRAYNAKVTVRRPYSRDYNYTGLIRCTGCGGQVTAHKTTKKSGRSYVYYHCQQRGGRCGWKSLNETSLDARIAQWLQGVTVLPEFIDWAWRAHQKWAESYRQARAESGQRAGERLKDVERQLENLLTLKLRDLITDEEYAAKKTRLQMEKSSLSERNEEAETTVRRVREVMENVTEFMKAARQTFESGTPTAKRAFLRCMGSNFAIDNGNLVWEPHPLLVPVKDSYWELERKFRGIKPEKIRSEGTEKGHLRPIILAWSRLWEENQTRIVEERLIFPTIAESDGLGKECMCAGNCAFDDLIKA